MDPEAVNLALLVARLSFGLMLFYHGYNKVFGGGGISGTARWFDGMGMRPGTLNAWMAALTEMGSGLLLAAGLLTSFAAAGGVALMVVAAYTVHLKNGFMILNEGWEYVFIIAIGVVLIATIGPGEWSLDDSIGIADDLDNWTGMVIAAVGGVAAGVGQLAIFYRPPAASS
ncbi:MAG: DoxX family protein [Acidimicrobiia bacterium]|nr:DoxX family protein [Acidimicrobiia bacterium]